MKAAQAAVWWRELMGPVEAGRRGNRQPPAIQAAAAEGIAKGHVHSESRRCPARLDVRNGTHSGGRDCAPEVGAAGAGDLGRKRVSLAHARPQHPARANMSSKQLVHTHRMRCMLQ